MWIHGDVFGHGGRRSHLAVCEDLVTAENANGPTVGGSHGREASLTVPAPKILVQELTTVENALKNPPKKADWVGMATALIGAALAVGKALEQFNAEHPALDLFIIMVACCVGAVAVFRTLEAKGQKTPFHDQALHYVQVLIKSMPVVPPTATTNLLGGGDTELRALTGGSTAGTGGVGTAH
jgi:hypothetical protein